VPENADAARVPVARQQTGYMPQKGRFAGPRRTDEGYHLTRRDADAHFVEGFVGPESLADGVYFDGGGLGGLSLHADLLF